MQKYVALIDTHRKFLYILLIFLILLAGAGIRRLDIDTDFTLFMPDTSEYKETLDQMNEIFGTSQQMMILLEAPEENLSLPLLENYRELQKFLTEMENTQFVSGPTPTRITSGETDVNFDNLKENDVRSTVDYYQTLGELSPIKHYEGNIYAVFTLFPEADFGIADIEQIETFLAEREENYFLSGDVYMQHKIIAYILSILFFLPPLAVILLFFVFRSQIGDIKSTFIALLPAIIGAQWTVGLIGWSGREVSMVSVLAPIFTIVIGSADGLHFVSHVQDSLQEGQTKIKSVVSTLKIVGKPIIITTLTSMIGFLSLMIMDTAAINDLATFAALGIFLAGIITWLVLPLILTGNFNLARPKAVYGNKISALIQKLWGKKAISLLFVLLIIAGWGSTRLNTEFNFLMIYREFTQVYQNHEKIQEIHEGSTPVFAFVETEQDPLAFDNARKIMALQQKLQKQESTTQTISPYSFIARMYASRMELPEPEYPDQQMVINMIYMMISQQEENPIRNLLAREQNTIRFSIFPLNLKNETLNNIESTLKDFNEENKDIRVRVTGAQYLMKDLNEMMIVNQRNTLYLAFFLIFLMLLISLRRFKPSIISLLPIIFTVIFLLGFLGISGISLNIITATIFSITIGVGVDYAVHFTSVWQYHKNKGLNSQKAAEKAYKYTARPILANAFGLAIGLSALLLSPIRLHLYVSILMWVAMMSGVFFSLSFLPTVLRKVK